MLLVTPPDITSLKKIALQLFEFSHKKHTVCCSWLHIYRSLNNNVWSCTVRNYFDTKSLFFLVKILWAKKVSNNIKF
jgi:predicted AAA+ superfamily ATPase